MKSRRRHYAIWPFALLLLSLSVIPAVRGQDRSMTGARFDVFLEDFDLADNQFRVIEVQELIIAGSYRLLNRDISLNNLDDITDITASFNGQPLTYDAACAEALGTFCVQPRENNERRVRAIYPRPVADETITVEISYTVVGALRSYPGGDQVQWRAVPEGHDYPIRSSTVRLTLPPGAEPRPGIDPSATEGAPGSIVVSGRQITARATGGIAPNTYFSVRQQYPHQPDMRRASWQGAEPAAAPPTSPSTAATLPFSLSQSLPDILAVITGAFLGLIVPLLLVMRWDSRWRTPPGPKLAVPKVLAQAPGDQPPAFVMSLLKQPPHARHVVATLLNLAERGYLRIVHGGGSTRFFRIDRGSAGLLPFEQKVLAELFPNTLTTRDERSLDDLKANFARLLPGLFKQINDDFDASRWVDQKRQGVKRAWGRWARVLRSTGCFAILVIALFAVFGAQVIIPLFMRQFQLAPWTNLLIAVVGGLVIVGVVQSILAAQISELTPAGRELKAKWRAFQEYLLKASKFTEMGYRPRDFSTYLPYAVAFGYDKEWVSLWTRRSTVEDVPAPGWFVPYAFGYDSGVSFGSAGSGYADATTGTLADAGAGMAGGLDALSTGLGATLNDVSSSLASLLDSASDALSSYTSSDGSWSGGGDGGGGDSGGGDGGGGDSGGGGSGGGDSGGGDGGGGDSGGGGSGGE